MLEPFAQATLVSFVASVSGVSVRWRCVMSSSKHFLKAVESYCWCYQTRFAFFKIYFNFVDWKKVDYRAFRD